MIMEWFKHIINGHYLW